MYKSVFLRLNFLDAFGRSTGSLGLLQDILGSLRVSATGCSFSFIFASCLVRWKLVTTVLSLFIFSELPSVSNVRFL